MLKKALNLIERTVSVLLNSANLVNQAICSEIIDLNFKIKVIRKVVDLNS